MRKEVTDTEVYCIWMNGKTSTHFALKKQDFEDILKKEGKQVNPYYIDDISPKTPQDRVKVEIMENQVEFTFRQNGKDIVKTITFNELRK
jgi:hypothetical protein